MERPEMPLTVHQEIAWRLQGGAPQDVQVIQGVHWARQFYPHTPLVAIVNQQDPSQAVYFRTREEVEAFITTLRTAMGHAWPTPTSPAP